MGRLWIWAAVLAVIVVALIMMVPTVPDGTKSPAAGGQATPASGKLKVAATIFPLADIVGNIGGEKVDVVTIMPVGASPHTFEPTPETIRTVSGAAMIFKIGSGLDDWTEKVTAAMQGKVSVVAVSSNIELRKFEDGSVDPHYWLSLANGQIIAVTVAKELSRIDEAGTEYYMANMKEYVKKLEAADARIKAKLAPVKGKSFATFHEAWFYFAREYGLEVAMAFEPFPGREPTPKYLAEFGDTVKKKNIKWVFSEPQFSSDAISQVAKDLGVKLGVLDPEGGMADDAKEHGYIPMMQRNAETILKALSE
jgi:ABC-type Zn uptake system ZnuABC Zn-binding protein ZnuA